MYSDCAEDTAPGRPPRTTLSRHRPVAHRPARDQHDRADIALAPNGGTVELLDGQVTTTHDGQLAGGDRRTLAVLG